ncbi:hypothetical protein SNEBB_008949 [Seison nebaliae]|nr:hypothetical protein SNEBB_008949 [Seison nebaliae]
MSNELKNNNVNPFFLRNENGIDSHEALKQFGEAKERINSIFSDVRKHFGGVIKFLEGCPSTILNDDDFMTISANEERCASIIHVLQRDRMKVVFFGRTSNGKSTVINSMLHDSILPSGMGHTTSCFLQVEGTDDVQAPFIIHPQTNKRLTVDDVGSLASALSKESLDSHQLVTIFWPRSRCDLLREDVVFVDSPGIDVTQEFDSCIDNYCLDADVFILVANAESTLMQAETNFFYKVTKKLSKPNIFIVHNRWDCATNECDISAVRQQHTKRAIEFLVDQLAVYGKEEAEKHIFFVSAKEMLSARKKRNPNDSFSADLHSEGFNIRSREFQRFETSFETCLSNTAVQTKFEQHTLCGAEMMKEVDSLLSNILCAINQSISECGERLIVKRKELEQFSKKRTSFRESTAKQVQLVLDDVERKVMRSFSTELKKLNEIVNRFKTPFPIDLRQIDEYKKELHSYVQKTITSNMSQQLDLTIRTNMNAIISCINESECVQMVSELKKQNFKRLKNDIDITAVKYNFESFCAIDRFKADIVFRFSLSLSNLLKMFRKFSTPSRYNGRETEGDLETSSPIPASVAIMPLLVTQIASLSPWLLGSSAVVVTVKTLGYQIPILCSLGIGGLYLYERVTWTSRKKRKAFNDQYHEFMKREFRYQAELIGKSVRFQVDLKATNVMQEVDRIIVDECDDREAECKNLNTKIDAHHLLATKAQSLLNNSQWLRDSLHHFINRYLNIVI